MPLLILIGLILIAGGLGIGKILENKQRIQQEIRDESRQQGIDENLALAIAEEESGFSSISAKDFETTGSWGIFQLEPGTASDMAGRPVIPHIDFVGHSGELLDIQLGVQYIGWLSGQLNGNSNAVIQAYNEGIGNYRKGKTDPVYLARVSRFYENWSAV